MHVCNVCWLKVKWRLWYHKWHLSALCTQAHSKHTSSVLYRREKNSKQHQRYMKCLLSCAFFHSQNFKVKKNKVKIIQNYLHNQEGFFLFHLVTSNKSQIFPSLFKLTGIVILLSSLCGTFLVLSLSAASYRNWIVTAATTCFVCCFVQTHHTPYLFTGKNF